MATKKSTKKSGKQSDTESDTESDKTSLTLRLPKELVERAKKLQPAFEQDERFRYARVTHSLVLRVAIESGLSALEAEFKAQK